LINATDNKTTHGRFAAPARDEFKINPKKIKIKYMWQGQWQWWQLQRLLCLFSIFFFVSWPNISVRHANPTNPKCVGKRGQTQIKGKRKKTEVRKNSKSHHQPLATSSIQFVGVDVVAGAPN